MNASPRVLLLIGALLGVRRHDGLASIASDYRTNLRRSIMRKRWDFYMPWMHGYALATQEALELVGATWGRALVQLSANRSPS